MYRHPKDAMFRAADSSNGHGEKMFATLDLAEVDAVMHASPLSSFISAVKEESPSLSAGMFKAEEDFYADSDLDMNPLQHLEASTTTSDASDEKNATDSDFTSQAAAADSNSSTPAKSFVPCKVCGDKASGYHYGVTSCEGCKGFFRRSIQKQIEYRCLRDGKCQVLRLNRNRCQFCRFKKCLSVGMSRDSVRYGRVPKCRTKVLETKLTSGASCSSTHFASSSSLPQNEQKSISPDSACTPTNLDVNSLDANSDEHLALYDTIHQITQAHVSNCFYTDDKIRHLRQHPAILSEPSPSSTPDSMHVQKIVMWQSLASLISPAIQRTVEFAKRTPNFGELSQEDQLVLIKGAFLEIWMVHAAKVTHHHQVTFQDGSSVTKQQLELIFEGEFTTGMFKFATDLQGLHLNDTDIALLSAIVLYTPDRLNLFDVKLVEQIQERLKDAMKLQLGRHHTNDAYLHQNLLGKLPELRMLNNKHCERLQWYRLQYQYLTNMPPLFAEIFDIPKSDEEFQLLLTSS